MAATVPPNCFRPIDIPTNSEHFLDSRTGALSPRISSPSPVAKKACCLDCCGWQKMSTTQKALTAAVVLLGGTSISLGIAGGVTGSTALRVAACVLGALDAFIAAIRYVARSS
jgi:hypothetical protein